MTSCRTSPTRAVPAAPRGRRAVVAGGPAPASAGWFPHDKQGKAPERPAERTGPAAPDACGRT